MTSDAPSPSSFSDIDQSSAPHRFIDYMDASHAGESAEERTYLRAPLRLRTAQRILDVGCGAGDELIALAVIVGLEGKVVGIDKSLQMLAAAGSRSPSNIHLAAADAQVLPFPNSYFDACRTERVLQHVSEPQIAVSEMKRVTASGGRIVAIEPDWGTLAIDSSNPGLTQKIVDYRSYHGIRNGAVGRQLRRIFLQCGLCDVEVHILVGRHEQFELADRLLGLTQLAARCAADGIISTEESIEWVDDLRNASQQGVFFAAMARIVAAGTKPISPATGTGGPSRSALPV